MRYYKITYHRTEYIKANSEREAEEKARQKICQLIPQDFLDNVKEIKKAEFKNFL